MQNITEQKIQNLLISLVCLVLGETFVVSFFSHGLVVKRQMASHNMSISAMTSFMVVSDNSKLCFLLLVKNELICEHAF